MSASLSVLFSPVGGLWQVGAMITPNGTGFPILGDSDCDYLQLQVSPDPTRTLFLSHLDSRSRLSCLYG